MAKVPHGRAARMVLAAALALVAMHASRADPQTVALQHASATFDRGAPEGGGPQPGSFNSGWVLPVVPAGWTLTSEQYGVSANGARLGFAFLPTDSPLFPKEDSLLRVWAAVAPASNGRFSDIYPAQAHLELPISFEAAPDWRISGYRVALTGDYVRSGLESVNGTLELNGSLGVDLQGGGHADIANLTLADRTSGTDVLRFEALLPAQADFRTLAGMFESQFILDPRPPTLPPWEDWPPNGEGTTSFYFRTLEIEVLTVPVPEPATALMLGLGAAALAWRHRRRAAAAAQA